MIFILPESINSLIFIKISGKITVAEYKDFIPYVESTIKKFGKIRVFVDLVDLDDWEWRVVWDDLAFGITHWNKFTKVAIVGHRRVERLSVWATNKITNGDIRFYYGGEATDALNWVKN